MKWISLTAVAALTACSGGAVFTGGSPETATTKELCKVVHWKRNGFDYGFDAAFSELQGRELFTAREMRNIRDGTPYVGDSEEAALCSRGYFYDDVNVTETAYGLRKQYVFLDGRMYVYTKNGMVTGIQY